MHQYYGNRDNDTANFLANTVDMDRFIKNIESVCDYVKAKKRSRKTMYISFDEWNVWYHADEANAKAEKWLEGPSFNEDIYNFEDALLAGGMLITLIKNADRVKVACQAQLVNVIAPVMTENGGRIWKQTIYYPYLHASVYGRGTALNLLVECPKYDTKDYTDVPVLDAAAVENEDGEHVTVFVMNKSLEAMEMECDLRDYPGCRLEEMLEMTCPDLKAVNTADRERVAPHRTDAGRIEDGKLMVKLEGYSWNVIRVKR